MSKYGCGHGHEDSKKIVHRPMPEENILNELADFFKIFGDLTRIRILYLLSTSEMCVCDIASSLDMTQSAISHQLRVLKQARLVKSRREGKSSFYSLDDEHVELILKQGFVHIQEKQPIPKNF